MRKVSRMNKRTRNKHRAIEIVHEIQKGQRGEDTNYAVPESGNRKDRRRYKKAARRFDKQHGEGAADSRLREALEIDPDPFAERFLR